MKLKYTSYLIASLAAGSLAHAADQTVAGNSTITGNQVVNGILKVQPAIDTVTSNVPTATGAGASNPDIGAFGAPQAGTTRVVTVLGGVDAVSTTTTGGGAEINNNGDTTLKSVTGSTVSGSYTRLTTVDVYNADQGLLAGTPVPGSQRYFAAYSDPANPGQYLPITQSFADLAALDAFVAATPITDPIFAPLGLQPVDLQNSGGNLSVGGNATVAGNTTTNGINNSGKKITDLAEGTEGTDAVNKGQLDSEAVARDAADSVLQKNIDDEALAREEADSVLQKNIDDEALAREEADSVLQKNIDDEALVREEADSVLQKNIDAEAVVREEADSVLQKNIDDEAVAREDADSVLQKNIDDEALVREEADSVLQKNIDSEAVAREDADSVLQKGIDAEAVVREEADSVLQKNIDSEAVAREDADSVLQDNIDSETVARKNSDAALQKNIDAEASTRSLADANIIEDYTNQIQAEETSRVIADDQIRSEFRSEDKSIRDEFRAADKRLRSDIDKNTRGIAMVAAMTNTTVEAGKTHGVDFNVAQFEGETGFSFGYANRINDNVQLHTAIASSQDFEEAVARIGVSVQW